MNVTVQEKVILLTITKPEGVVSHYIVQCKAERDTALTCIPGNQTVQATEPTLTLTYNNLSPHTMYRYTVQSWIPTGEVSKEIIHPVQTTQAREYQLAIYLLFTLFSYILSWKVKIFHNA